MFKSVAVYLFLWNSLTNSSFCELRAMVLLPPLFSAKMACINSFASLLSFKMLFTRSLNGAFIMKCLSYVSNIPFIQDVTNKDAKWFENSSMSVCYLSILIGKWDLIGTWWGNFQQKNKLDLSVTVFYDGAWRNNLLLVFPANFWKDYYLSVYVQAFLQFFCDVLLGFPYLLYNVLLTVTDKTCLQL